MLKNYSIQNHGTFKAQTKIFQFCGILRKLFLLGLHFRRTISIILQILPIIVILVFKFNCKYILNVLSISRLIHFIPSKPKQLGAVHSAVARVPQGAAARGADRKKAHS